MVFKPGDYVKCYINGVWESDFQVEQVVSPAYKVRSLNGGYTTHLFSEEIRLEPRVAQKKLELFTRAVFEEVARTHPLKTSADLHAVSARTLHIVTALLGRPDSHTTFKDGKLLLAAKKHVPGEGPALYGQRWDEWLFG